MVEASLSLAQLLLHLRELGLQTLFLGLQALVFELREFEAHLGFYQVFFALHQGLVFLGQFGFVEVADFGVFRASFTLLVKQLAELLPLLSVCELKPLHELLFLLLGNEQLLSQSFDQLILLLDQLGVLFLQRLKFNFVHLGRLERCFRL